MQRSTCDITELEDSLLTGGIEALTAQVKERLQEGPNGPMYYLLQDPKGKVIAGIFRPPMAEKVVSI